LVSSMAILQAWLYMTNYVNHYSTWRWYEYLLVAVNMVGAIYMSQTITGDWSEVSTVFLVSMISMISCVAILYVVQIRVGRQDDRSARTSLGVVAVVISVYAAALLISLSDFSHYSVFASMVAVFLGIILPFVAPTTYDKRIVSFPHLVERFELLTIITFGEAIVGMTGLFDPSAFTVAPILVFANMLLLFGCYVAQVHYMCNHHQVSRGRGLMFMHYFIVISINLMTVAILYFESTEADHTFTAMLMVASNILFFLALFSLEMYNRFEFPASWTDLVLSMVPVVVGASVIFAFITSPYGFLLGSIVMSAGNFLILLRKHNSNRCVNVIHT
ncbi:MAG: low temperature requirement protein A, partial [Candidatus Methanomethylophilaceae archaeon]|nr:low temperature requirement protein A [Candidatus Methanomethylophilaceae archaeon]